MRSYNFWIEIDGKSIHLGKYSEEWKFIWNIRSILSAILCHLKLNPIRKDEVKNTLKTLEVLENAFEVDFYDCLQIKDNIDFSLRSSGVSDQWIKSHSFLFKPIDTWRSDEVLPNFGMRIPIKHINSGLILYWVAKLFEKGMLVSKSPWDLNLPDSDEMTEDLTWDNFISKVTNTKGEDTCSFGKYSRGNYNIHWNYVIGDLCCSSIEFFN